MVYLTDCRKEKLIKFAKDNTRLKVYDRGYGNGTFKRRSFKCPCCDFESWNGISDEEDKYILQGFRGYILHLNAQIRLHASQEHIKVFEELFGKERTTEFIRFAIAKNKAVTKELERIYQERQEELKN